MKYIIFLIIAISALNLQAAPIVEDPVTVYENESAIKTFKADVASQDRIKEMEKNGWVRSGEPKSILIYAQNGAYSVRDRKVLVIQEMSHSLYYYQASGIAVVVHGSVGWVKPISLNDLTNYLYQYK